jgi:uncharacterized HAD superfamily protein
MRIAIDIDSTLHHYWDQFADVARRRFGIDLRYEDQVTWELLRLRPSQVRACVAETHADRRVLAARPYPGAVETVRAWHEAGHVIHVMSHREPCAHGATERWLHEIGLPYDELYCSHDKVARCVELGMDLLIDDAPANLVRALERGMHVATLIHPWNRDVCEEEDVTCARDWPELARRLAPLLARETART